MGRLGSSVAAVLVGAVALSCATPALGHGGSVDALMADGVKQWLSLQPPRITRQAPTTPEPALVATPRATCRPGSTPEPGMQGRVAKEDVDSGKAAAGYACNMTVVGHSGSTGGFRVHRYIDKAGHECAYYDTTLLFPTNLTSASGEIPGVAVLDMSDPSKPVRTTTLLTPAMQTPHESLNISIQRGVLAAVMGNPFQAPGGVDVYDISADCRRPVLKRAVALATPFGHESGMAPDGMTFYPSSPGSQLSAVDLTDLANPRTLLTTDVTSHGLDVSDDGRTGYFAQLGGLKIVDLSDVQDRKPNPQIREISSLTWKTMSIPQYAVPLTIKGKKYVMEVDEFSVSPDGGVAGNGPVVGAARMISVEDLANPRVVSDMRLEVHQPENRAAIAGDYGAASPLQGYAGHYCNVPRRVDPGIVACSMIASGLRVFDVRDPEHPKELAYFVAPPNTLSVTGAPIINERSNWAMSQPAFAPERGEIWYSDGNSGFYALKVDPAVWPFPQDTNGSCTDSRGIGEAGVSGTGSRLRVKLLRRRELPVQVDVFRVSDGRRVLRERRVARFAARTGSFTASTRLGAGVYFARFRMLDGGRVVDTQRVTFERSASGAVRPRTAHYRRDTCQLLRTFKLERPAFGGTADVPLRIAYRLTSAADVRVVVRRGGRTVRTFTRKGSPAGGTLRFTLPAGGLTRGEYRVQLRATGATEQVVATLAARRL